MVHHWRTFLQLCVSMFCSCFNQFYACNCVYASSFVTQKADLTALATKVDRSLYESTVEDLNKMINDILNKLAASVSIIRAQLSLRYASTASVLSTFFLFLFFYK